MKDFDATTLKDLRDFAGFHGRFWKARLRLDWELANKPHGHYTPALVTLRNTHGPTWLAYYKLPPKETGDGSTG